MKIAKERCVWSTCDTRRRFSPSDERYAGLLLQRAKKCGATCQCASCAERSDHKHWAPPEVTNVISRNGDHLDVSTRLLARTILGRDFSHVRVHTDAQAAASAQSVDALAYTVGRHIVFGAGHYAPYTPAGNTLLLHELTHVVQQDGRGDVTRGPIAVGAADTPHEREASHVGQHGMHAIGQASRGLPPTLQRQPAPTATPTGNTAAAPTPSPAALDATARAIIAAASNATVPVGQRAVAVVRAIINTYYAGDVSLVSRVVSSSGGGCDPTKSPIRHGLSTTAVGSGASTTGCIEVADEFGDFSANASSRLAHRVLQVDHELEHIRQYRAGRGGDTNRALREFLAFTREARSPAVAHTGTVTHSTRVQIINAAVGEYFCLPDDQRSQYRSDYEWLHNERARHAGKGKDPDPPEPTSCSPSSSPRR